MIKLENVEKKFRCGWSIEQFFNPLQVQALENITFEHPPGEVLRITGPAGAGKSVLINLLAGLYRPDSGEIRIFSQSPADSYELRRDIGVVAAESGNLDPELSARRNLELLAGLYDVGQKEARSRAEETLEYVDIERAEQEVPLGELSPGLINLVNIASGLIPRPELLLLDEPATYLGFAARDRLNQLLQGLKQQGMTLVLATKKSALLESLGGRRLELKDGRRVDYETV